MDAGSIDRLLLRQGEPVTDRSLRQLEAGIARQTPTRGPGVRRRYLPWGIISNYSGRGGTGGVSPIFAPEVTRKGGALAVRWYPGLIDGVEPSVNGTLISGVDPNTRRAPAYLIPSGAFADGQTLIYWRLNLDHTFWSPVTGPGPDGEPRAAIEPIAFAAPPVPGPWTHYKLAVIISDRGAVLFRPLYSNLGFLATNRRASSGLSVPEYWSVS